MNPAPPVIRIFLPGRPDMCMLAMEERQLLISRPPRKCKRAADAAASATATVASHWHGGDDDIVDELGRVEPGLHRRDEMPELRQHGVVAAVRHHYLVALMRLRQL